MTSKQQNDSLAEAIDKNWDNIMAELDKKRKINEAMASTCVKCGWYLTYTALTTYKACPWCLTPFEEVNP